MKGEVSGAVKKGVGREGRVVECAATEGGWVGARDAWDEEWWEEGRERGEGGEEARL